MKRILLINNYDSFVFNVKQLIDESGIADVTIVLNDELDHVDFNQFDKIIISPGPGIPSEAGSVMNMIDKHYQHIPILGICLGFQAIGEVFGGVLYPLPNIYHGHQSHLSIVKADAPIFKGVSSPFLAGRYHSWAIDAQCFPDTLEITSITEDGIIMSYQHKQYPITALLFHPESIMTPDGNKMINNWLSE